MGLILFFLTITGFILYFYSIGLWYLGFLPLLIFVGFLGYYTSTLSIKSQGKYIVEKYGMFLARIIILTGLVGVLHFMGVNLLTISQVLLVLNLVLRLGSHIIEYIDGKRAFQGGYYLSVIFLVVISIPYITFWDFINLVSILRFLSLGVCGFIVFIIGTRKETEKNLRYKLLILGVGAILFFIVKVTNDVYASLLINTLVLTTVYYIFYRIVAHKPLKRKQREHISLRRILAGERLSGPKQTSHSDFFEQIYQYVQNVPSATKYFFEGVNILIVLILVAMYVYNIDTPLTTVQQVTFRGIIISFTANVILLKKLGYTSVIQKLIVFAVINFAIYVSLFSVFGENYGSIAFRAILWNIASGILIFSLPQSMRDIFQKRDYTYRLVTVLVALVLNVVILTKSQIEGQLVFSLVFLYLGLQGMILFYAGKYINTLD